MTDATRVGGTTQNAKPAAKIDSTVSDVRVNRFGESVILNLFGDANTPLADEGSYFVATNPTMGTAITMTTSLTAYAATTPNVILYNNAPTSSSGPFMYIDYIRVIVAGLPTSATAWDTVMTLDNITTKYTSGGSTLTAVNVNMNSAATSIAKVYAGAITAVTTSSAGRIIHRSKTRTVIPVAGDQYTYVFGRPAGLGNIVTSGTSSIDASYSVAPVVLGPGQSLSFYQFGGSNGAAPTFELEIGWSER